MSQILKDTPAQAQNAVELYGGQVLLHFDRVKHACHIIENGSTRRAVCLPCAEQDADLRAFLAAKTLFERLAQFRNGGTVR